MTDRSDRLRRVVQRLTPDQLRTFAASLDDSADVALLEEVLGDLASEAERSADAAVSWRADPARMAHHLTAGKYQLWPYVTLLGEAFARTTKGSAGRLIVNLPAQFGKSQGLSQWGPAWHLDRWPDRSIILASYGDELAVRNALAVRDILEGHPDVLRARLRRDQRRKDRFLTDEGGGILATGINGAATGFPAHGVVIDDPFKNWQEAHSEARRNHVWNQYRAVFRLRLTTDDAWVIVVMTRWHESDLSGKLQQEAWEGTGEVFDVIRLPEIAEAPDLSASDPVLRLPDPLGRQPGEPLEPRRFSLASSAAKQLTLGPYLWAGLAQQRPSPEAGTDILREWFRIEEDTWPARADEAITSWDMKLKDKEAGDFVVGQCWWRVGGGFWLAEQLRGQWNEATTKVAMALLTVRHPEAKRHYFENTGNGPELAAELRRGDDDYVIPDDIADRLGMTPSEREAVQAVLRRGMSSLLPVKPVGDKRVRMRVVSPVIAGGNVHLPAGAVWLAHYLEEMAAFPNGAHDDVCDATSQALSKLYKAPASAAAASEQPSAPAVPVRGSAVAGGERPRTILTVSGRTR